MTEDLRSEASDSIGRGGHDTRRQPHGPLDRRRQLGCTEPTGRLTMSHFVILHGAHNGPRGDITLGQSFHMPGQMFLNLPLGFNCKPQRSGITRPGGQ